MTGIFSPSDGTPPPAARGAGGVYLLLLTAFVLQMAASMLPVTAPLTDSTGAAPVFEPLNVCDSSDEPGGSASAHPWLFRPPVAVVCVPETAALAACRPPLLTEGEFLPVYRPPRPAPA